MASPDEILAYWLDEVGPSRWYGGGDDLDSDIRNRFESDWERARDGALSLWLTYPTGALAYIILTDQFSRNMFRGEAMAFQTDKLALAAAKAAISRGWDLRVDEPARVFFYMPLCHSECLVDQDRCVRLMLTRMPVHGAQYMLHAKAHREVIRMFGRFPFRNEALDRDTPPAEAVFLSEGGYGATVRALEATA
jgi:uncharacterized protein (DUF924 family)